MNPRYALAAEIRDAEWQWQVLIDKTVREGKSDLIVTKSVSRFARNTADSLKRSDFRN